ncbi:MAG: hypothetical protein EXQ99_08890 [Alphaproteobacteria bacterium]|nr:hypothetical protein [Alphaproteobacteria bacterium]
MRRIGRGRLIAPFHCEWDEAFGEWIMPKLISQTRDFSKGPLNRLVVEMALTPNGGRTHARTTMRVSCDRCVTDIVVAIGVLNSELDKRNRAIIKAADQVRAGRPEWSLVEPSTMSAARQSRLDACRSTLVAHG